MSVTKGIKGSENVGSLTGVCAIAAVFWNGKQCECLNKQQPRKGATGCLEERAWLKKKAESDNMPFKELSPYKGCDQTQV